MTAQPRSLNNGDITLWPAAAPAQVQRVGRAVAWREWAGWRAGGTTQPLVKHLHGATLENGHAWAVAA